MLRDIVRWIAARLSPPRRIYGQSGVDVYLSRWYLTARPTMPDGSEPFDNYGNPREGIVWPSSRCAIYLHRFHRSDEDRALHNHPWRWALSLVLVGGYSEERRIGDRVVRRLVRPLRFNWIGHDTYHRVDLIEDDAWSIFIVGPKVSSWEFWTRETGRLTPWREFIAAKQTGAPS